MSEQQYDVIVIGSGPGGEGAAMKATKAGKRVAVIEEKAQVGGNCTHSTTIPSKALRQAIQQMIDTNSYAGTTYQQLRQSAERVIEQQVHLRTSFYERNLVDTLHGRATFVDAHTIAIVTPGGLTTHYAADYFVIATGARPYQPADIDLPTHGFLTAIRSSPIPATRARLPSLAPASSAASMRRSFGGCGSRST